MKTERLTADLESAKEEMSNLVPRSELVHTPPGHEREREQARASERARHSQSERKLERKSAHEKDRKRETDWKAERNPKLQTLTPKLEISNSQPFRPNCRAKRSGRWTTQ